MHVKLMLDSKYNSPSFADFVSEYRFKRHCNVAGAMRTVADPDELKSILNFHLMKIGPQLEDRLSGVAPFELPFGRGLSGPVAMST